MKTTLVAFGVGIAGFAVGIALILLTALLLSTLPDTFELSTLGGVLLSTVLLQGVAFPIVAVAYLRWRGLPYSFLRARLPSLRDLGYAVVGLIGAFALVILASNVISLLGLSPAGRADQDIITRPNIAIVMIPLAILVIGPGEELLFRGVIQTTLTEEFPTPVAIVLASLAFAPAHIPALTGSAAAIALSVSVLFLPSLVFGAVYEFSDNLVVPSLSHGLYNAILFAFVLLGPPMAPTQGLLLPF